MRNLPTYAARARPRPALWLLLAVLASYPLAGVLPPSWAVENGVVENLQVAVLAVGCLAAVHLARRSSQPADARLAAILVPVWITLIGRELSWGAVFLPPSAVVDGVALYSSRFLWYKPAVAPAIMLAALVVLAIAWRQRLFGHAGRILAGQPALAPLLLIGAAAGGVAAWSEGHLGSSATFPHARAMAWEELLELIAYGALVAAQWAALPSPALESLPAPVPSRLL